MEEMNRKLAIQSLFDSQGYKLFKEELDGLVESVIIERENLSKAPCKDFILNFLNGKKNGLQLTQYILDGFREELEVSAEER